MSRGKLTVLILTLCALAHGSTASGVDPTHGATNFVIVPAGLPWHPIGPAKLITTWSGPFINVGGHPATVYMFFAKDPGGHSHPIRPMPNNIRIYHMLGTDFYYPTNAKIQSDPQALGYTADGFAVADRLGSAFPAVGKLFSGGFEESSCRSQRHNYTLILVKNSGAAYLVSWQVPRQVDDVAYIPANLLKGSLESVLDHMSYYEQGGMVELMRFGALSYYLSRVPPAQSTDSPDTSRECPDTPTATANGVSTPEGWTKALESLQGK